MGYLQSFQNSMFMLFKLTTEFPFTIELLSFDLEAKNVQKPFFMRRESVQNRVKEAGCLDEIGSGPPASEDEGKREKNPENQNCPC